MKPLFSTGEVVVTPGALEVLNYEGWEARALEFVQRHVSGDWGDVCPHDAKLNNSALINNDGQLLSEYTVNGTRIWIITEADRSSTTILLPEEY